jgi:GT2 family glycosyltransferase
MQKDLLISVVIPVKERPDTLGECLEALGRQEFDNTEVIVVHDAASADMPEIPGKGGGPRAIAHHGKPGLGAMVEAGMRAARGHVRVLLMPHCIPVGPNWLEQMAAPFQDPEAGATVSGCYAPPRKELKLATCLLDAVEPHRRYCEPEESGVRETVSHLADAYRAEMLADIGYFEAEHLRTPAEAVELTLRVEDAGYSIVRAPDATVECHPQESERSLQAAMGRALDYGFSDAVLETRYGMRWLNSGVHAAALLSLVLLPLAAFSIQAATALSLGLLVWGFFLGIPLPHLRWEVPVAALNFAAWAAVVWVIRDDWWPELFGRDTHPSIIRQWCWFGAVTGSYLLLVCKAALGTGWRALWRRGGLRYALPVAVVSAAWWVVTGVGYVHGRLAAPSEK